MLSAALADKASEITGLKKKMEGLSEGRLRDFLSTYDANSGNFQTSQDFVDFLKSHADSLGFNATDVDNVLLKLAYDGDLNDIIRKLAEYARPTLKERLLSMDPGKEDIHTISDLLANLFRNPDGYNYSEDDVISMLSDYTTMSDLELFLRKMIEVSEGNTRDFLTTVNPAALHIRTKQELVSWLLNQADKGNMDKADMIHVILMADRIPLETMLPVLKKLASDEILKLLENVPSGITMADDLFIHLLSEAGRSNDVTEKDILDLFSNYLNNYDLQIFRRKLLENATGKLHELISSADLRQWESQRWKT